MHLRVVLTPRFFRYRGTAHLCIIHHLFSHPRLDTVFFVSSLDDQSSTPTSPYSPAQTSAVQNVKRNAEFRTLFCVLFYAGDGEDEKTRQAFNDAVNDRYSGNGSCPAFRRHIIF